MGERRLPMRRISRRSRPKRPPRSEHDPPNSRREEADGQPNRGWRQGAGRAAESLLGMTDTPYVGAPSPLARRLHRRVDPYDHAISADFRRRHPTVTQKREKRELIAKLLMANPGRSDRATAAIAKVDPTTVGSVRKDLETTSEIPKLEKRVCANGQSRTVTPVKITVTCATCGAAFQAPLYRISKGVRYCGRACWREARAMATRICDGCGAEFAARVRSIGILTRYCSRVCQTEAQRKYPKKTGSASRLYKAWKAMRERCYTETCKSYVNYGGRGIAVCDEWRDYEPFRIWSLENGYGEDLEIDRIDNDGDYEPANCRWTTHVENMRNRRGVHLLTAFDETKTIPEWAEDPRCAVTYNTLSWRLSKGWPPEMALTSIAFDGRNSRPAVRSNLPARVPQS
jgi:hypothetical protein